MNEAVVMKEMELKAIKDLLEIYELFFSDISIDLLQVKAEYVYLEYRPASNILLSNLVARCVEILISFAYPALPDIVPPTREDVKSIIEKLKEEQKKLTREENNEKNVRTTL